MAVRRAATAGIDAPSNINVKGTDLSLLAKRHSARLRLKRIRRKIVSVEAEITLLERSSNPKPSLFEEEHPALRSLRETLDQLRELLGKNGKETA